MGGKALDGVLTVLRGVADVVFFRTEDVRIACGEPLDEAPGVVDRQRRLGDVGAAFGVEREPGDVLLGLDEVDAIGHLPHRAFHLGMPSVADHHDVVALAVQALYFVVHLGHQRAGGVEHGEAARAGPLMDSLGHAVGAEDDHGSVGYLVELFDEDGAARAQRLDHVAVVHDLVAHVDGGAEVLERPLDDLDGPIDSGTEAAGIGEQDGGGGVHGIQLMPMMCTSSRTVLPASGWLKSTTPYSSVSSRTSPA